MFSSSVSHRVFRVNLKAQLHQQQNVLPGNRVIHLVGSDQQAPTILCSSAECSICTERTPLKLQGLETMLQFQCNHATCFDCVNHRCLICSKVLATVRMTDSKQEMKVEDWLSSGDSHLGSFRARPLRAAELKRLRKEAAAKRQSLILSMRSSESMDFLASCV